ncbi:2-C-methyl-D-erythritol 4-phosphate cytidylyltransferase [Sporosarcina sp. 179-K 8C2 HS]|uniref:IspD/TarI family cytidylyltransferase n=1 Tax=Sporosarcina sp. 179-K 8C2 HS TaxID=3142387 RepID=UPI0039A2F652
MSNYGAIVLAGGKGNRFNGKKQFVSLDGKVLWKHVYDKVANIIGLDNIVVVGVDLPGGSTRSESVKKGINYLNSDTERVIILEAARPLVKEEQIKELLLCTHPSASFVMPLINTVVNRDGSFLNREEMYELLTPQAFDFALLKQAYNSNRFFDMTDETRVIYEYHKIKPFFIEGEENLIKLTYKRDLHVIEAMLKQQRKEMIINEKGNYNRG